MASTRGFTEEDQTRLAEETVAQSLAKGSKAGLGFGGGSNEADKKNEKQETEARGGSKQDGKDSKKRDRRSRSRGRDEDEGRKKRRHSKSRSRDRRRGNSRERRSRSRSRDRRRDQEKDRRRSRSRSRRRSRSRERRRSRSGSRHRSSRRRSKSCDKDRSDRRRRSPSRERGREKRREDQDVVKGASSSLLPAIPEAQTAVDPMVLVHSIAERIKARADAAAQEAHTMAAVHEAAQRMREKVAASLLSAEGQDEQLRRTTNRGHGWERPEMANAADFFQREEANTLGNTGSTEAYMKRLQMIAAIEDEKVDNLEGTVQERETLKKSEERRKVRRRQRKEDERKAREAEADLPLYKRLRAGDTVDAKYSADGKYYEATIKQVIHGGYPIAMFGVLFTEYGNEEEVSWRDCRFVEAAKRDSPTSSDGESSSEDDGEKGAGGSPNGHGTSAGQGDEDMSLLNPSLLAKKPPGLSWKDRVAQQKKQQQQQQPPQQPAKPVTSISAAAAALQPVPSTPVLSVAALTQQLVQQEAQSKANALVQNASRPKVQMALGAGSSSVLSASKKPMR